MTSNGSDRTAKGTVKRDPNAPKKEPPATPEERAQRIAEARARAEAARAAGGSAAPAPRAAAPAPETAAVPAETAPVAEAPAAGGGGLRTAKGTLKRDPSEAKKEPPATPEERARRVAEAKARAAAARAAREAGGAPGLQPAAAAAAAGNVATRPAGESDTARAERQRVFETVTRGVPGAEPVLRPVTAARAERPPTRAEFPMTDQMQEVVRLCREVLAGIAFEVLTSPLDAILVVDRADVLRVMQLLKGDPRLDMKFLRCISGVDQLDEGIEVVYHLKSITTRHSLAVKTLLPPRDLVVDSMTPVWAAADWHERELMEMFGVVCRNHPDPRNLLLDEDMTIHPLLKAHPLAEVELKQGVNVF